MRQIVPDLARGPPGVGPPGMFGIEIDSNRRRPARNEHTGPTVPLVASIARHDGARARLTRAVPPV